jgi:hypothetical protein
MRCFNIGRDCAGKFGEAAKAAGVNSVCPDFFADSREGQPAEGTHPHYPAHRRFDRRDQKPVALVPIQPQNLFPSGFGTLLPQPMTVVATEPL